MNFNSASILSLKSHFSRFLKAHQPVQHFAAHSHHFWPDVTRHAQLQAWDDAAQYSDQKWGPLFSKILPEVKNNLSSLLGITSADRLCFASNTHELLIKIFSLLDFNRPLKILTSKSEFHSFSRQLKRWQEIYPDWQVERLVSEDLLHKDAEKSFEEWLKKIRSNDWDIIFLSHVFFNSGLALTQEQLSAIVQAAGAKPLIVIDGYHAVGAIPVDLQNLEKRIFYLGGGYKYLMSGENMCFMSTPDLEFQGQSFQKFPTLTGWWAEFSDLSQSPQGQVPFSQDGMRFMGATMDVTCWYRFMAVQNWLREMKVTPQKRHEHVRTLQQFFWISLSKASSQNHLLSPTKPLFKPTLVWHGHFLTFEANSSEEAQKIESTLLTKQVLIDRRGSRLRFGFALYHDQEDIMNLIKTLHTL
jgi:selenocysteine lyase/cysteine desulfurase